MGLHGWRLAALIGAALVGGYLLSTAAGIFLGGALPVSRSESTLIGHLLSFVIYTGAVLWVFYLRKPGPAWLSLSLTSMVLAVLGLFLRG
ncbi:hypothetical protein [Marinimicrobium sp. LS-A18]|uniref:hypothetical protein n=1 Tax=Marinimicrobium sp. LS-A18 TaxID=1381596 RepID=UPI0004655161|nr:hypothetical protein [Marinimicrobium sp. LS-A18]